MNSATSTSAGWHDLSSRLPSGDGWMHSGVAVLADGRLVVAHPEGGRLLLVSPDGGPTEVVATPLTEMHAIVRTVRDGTELVWIADNGHRFVPDHDTYTGQVTVGRAVLLDLGGKIVQELGCPDLPAYAASRWSPTSVAVDDDSLAGSGEVWVADGYGASLLHRYAADGTYLATVDGSDSGLAFSCPHGLMLTASDDGDGGDTELYVADRSNHRIVVLDRDGGYRRAFGDDHLDSPSSLVRVGTRIYVTELFGGIACFDGEKFVQTLESSRTRSPQDPAWPNDLDDRGRTVAPALAPGALNSPHGITSDDTTLYWTEWLIGGRLIGLTL
jgi:DNA-binding beta-propeller fold protein YncE